MKFGVSVVTEEEFDSLEQEKLQYNYSWIYDEKPKTEKEEKEVSEDLMEDMGKIVTLEAFCTPVSESGHLLLQGMIWVETRP